MIYGKIGKDSSSKPQKKCCSWLMPGSLTRPVIRVQCTRDILTAALSNVSRIDRSRVEDVRELAVFRKNFLKTSWATISNQKQKQKQKSHPAIPFPRLELHFNL